MTISKQNPFYTNNEDDNILRIFIIRHGQTEHNVLKILQGHKDIPINNTGFEQAEKLGVYLKEQNIHFDKVFSSDLIRCQETLQTVLKFSNQTKVPVELTSALRERHMGVIEGMHIGDAERYADKHGKGSFRDFGEGFEEFTKRLTDGIHHAVDESNEENLKNISLMSHGGAIRTILKWLDYNGQDAQKIIVFNTSVTIVDYMKDTKQFIVKSIGNTQHLGDGEFVVSDLRLR
ncbi:similar to Saccharomyces cerevisiae YOR283W Phosphatase with a broad substrate specificity and some similarity to GPM1/YKL152C, a phosphoglycerate mutase [Maudiozyma saulgeensis]|uniref:Similar to Saccharomyces cerevisiae YOR283W Phosphatase with a broad substrate specificity and some similarity to GPM1/YKL152C, a phosphoglycerate mutase n=1 Tax=Maudiozyma saulgeensis TaxID=1789683 RepID=A0A1X7R4G7_9SACH|nr:similar to Saccharomyces cerevisiae YOR283W Phosphatase with a broad substrate specificity and some similarity to GPM1/YKL152C, a phosphoglycerate mutase [Kazachstania saulgeensis]